jgi:eukaryotic-like serine/threonine-protein kinase
MSLIGLSKGQFVSFNTIKALVFDTFNRPRDRLIQPGVPLAEAEKLVQDFGRELPAELTGYVTASRHRARARQRVVAAAAVFFFALAIAATGAGIMAYRAQREAVRAEQQAVAERDRATRSFKLAQRKHRRPH